MTEQYEFLAALAGIIATLAWPVAICWCLWIIKREVDRP